MMSLTFCLFTQVSDSGPYGPLVFFSFFFFFFFSFIFLIPCPEKGWTIQDSVG